MKKIKMVGVDETLINETLSNGLKVYLLPNKNVKNFYMTFSTKFGSNDTEFKKTNAKKTMSVPNGTAHFLEHLTFKMKGNIDATDYFVKLGSDVNAYTTFNVTCYEVFGYDLFKENLETLLDFVQTPFYTEKLVEEEKGIIKEEVKMYDDDIETELIFRLFKNSFHKDNTKNLVSGTVEDVQSISLNDLEKAYKTFYHPSNMYVTITGNFNAEEALAIIEGNQEKKKFPRKESVIKIKEKEPNTVVKEFEEIKRDVEIDKVNIGLKIPYSAFSSLKLTRLQENVYINILTNSMFGRTSKIKEKLVSGNIITDGLYVSRTYLENHVFVNIIAETPYPKRYITLMEEAIKEFEIEEDELIRKKRVAISNLIKCFDDIEETNNLIQSDILEYGDINANLYNIYNDLNIKTAKKIASKINTKNKSILVVKKKKTEKK
ncbi:MAG: pitrilysin family protein [Bacilli bacterium]|nr:pitrilysin family protein [Bacilli bacterium]